MSTISKAANEISVQENDISAETIPSNPEPYKNVTVTLSSYATDLNKAFITWQSGASIVLTGYGKTSYSFTAGGPNVITVMDVSISLPGSIDKVTKRIAINPSEVELIWEGVDSYTPPFYRGKSLITKGGIIKVVAIPNTNTIKQGKGSVTYSWKSGNSSVQSASGYNKDAYVFKNSDFNDIENVSVTAESINGQYTASSTLAIPTTSPLILFYKKSPTEGILYNTALADNTFISEDELTIVAEPYFLAFEGNESLFAYNWKINGSPIDTPSKKTELTIRPAARGGYASINITLENLNELYQKAIGQIKLSL